MRKYLLLVLIYLFLAPKPYAQVSQSITPFKVDLGYGVAFGTPGGKGMLLYLEPSYTIANRYKMGLRFEQALESMKNTGSYGLTFDYYLTSKPSFRLFAGGGYGYYNSNPTGGCDPGYTTTQIITTTKRTGGMLRLGFESAHFRLGLEYNFAPSTYVTVMGSTDQTNSTAVYKNEYLGLKAGILIGGHKKKSRNAP